MSELTLFPGDDIGREDFGEDDRGLYVVAAPFVRALGYRDVYNAGRLLEDDEKGTRLVSTPGGDQRVSIIYESGIWRLIFRSNRPEARALTTRVSEILTEIRRTGRYGTPQHEIPQTYADALQLAASQAKELEAARPAVKFVENYVDTTGLYRVGEVAAILKVRGMGQNNLFNFLRDHKVMFRANGKNIPMRQHIEAGRFEMKAQTYGTDAGDVATSTPYVTAKGLLYIRDLLERNGYECTGELSA